MPVHIIHYKILKYIYIVRIEVSYLIGLLRKVLIFLPKCSHLRLKIPMLLEKSAKSLDNNYISI